MKASSRQNKVWVGRTRSLRPTHTSYLLVLPARERLFALTPQTHDEPRILVPRRYREAARKQRRRVHTSARWRRPKDVGPGQHETELEVATDVGCSAGDDVRVIGIGEQRTRFEHLDRRSDHCGTGGVVAVHGAARASGDVHR